MKKSSSQNFSPMPKDSRIYVAGHRGLVGSAIVRRLKVQGHTNIISRIHAELDLIDQQAVAEFFVQEKPEYVFLAAAKVGGIQANNTYPAEFIYQNLMMEANVIHQSYLDGAKKLLFLGSSCIYPKICPQPMKEEYLMTGPLEPTNSPYAVAKIAGVEMCWSYNRQHGTNYIPVMPTNLYGPNDNYNLETSHVLPALIRKFHIAKLASKRDWDGIQKDEAHYGRIPDDIKESLKFSRQPTVVLWGTGAPKREFLHVDDLADACIFLMNLSKDQYDGLYFSRRSCPLVNIGTGKDQTIKALAYVIAKIVGFEGEIVFDTSRPDGTSQKLLDVLKLNNCGWQAKIKLEYGIQRLYEWYLDNNKL